VAGAPRTLDFLCQPCRSHFQELRGYLEGRDIGYELNPYLVRGLDYYTRTVFEIQPAEVRGQSAIGGGGRYDNLIEQLGGRPTPAVGFATGLERIMANMKEQDITPPATPANRHVFVVSADEAGRRQAPAIAAALHQDDISATFASGENSLKSQMRQAGSSGSRWAVIVGSAELSRGAVILRDMASASQEEMPLAEAIRRIKAPIP
jgi:histidyl-tRNA synthetase